ILDPCCERTMFNGVTYGLGPAGYDLRVATAITLWPGTSVLVDAIERFSMPSDVIGFLFSKSTWGRLHIAPGGAVIEPGWRGVLRIPINMHAGHEPVTVLAGTGIAQVVFMRVEEPTERPYDGKYQDQGPSQEPLFEVGDYELGNCNVG
ncbi:MAG: hypothetical protein WBF47_27345, partial [Xanthobacteraceae bacterium]